MNREAIQRAIDEPFRRAIAPEPSLLAWQWAEKHRILPSDSPEPGPKSYDRTPYFRFVSECLSPQSPYEQVVVAKGAQIGGTDLGADWHGHTIHLSPSTILVVWPSAEFAQRKSRELFDPLIESTPVLRELVAPPRSKDAQNTILVKRFPGGRLVMVGANSGIGLRSTAAQRVHLDEVDAFSTMTGKEGDPVKLALRATRTFKGRRKIYMVSTPLIEATSLIWRELQRADRMCDYHLPCPHCGEFQALVWEQMRWEVVGEGEGARGAGAHYECKACRGKILNHDKATMLGRGKWVDRWNRGGSTSIAFHISALYSPVGWYSWDEAVDQWITAKGNPGEEQIFVNTVLGLPWSDPADAPDWTPLYNRRTEYAEGVVQRGVALLTLGVDVQHDRLEVELRGWGEAMRSWSLLYRVIVGDPMDKIVWSELDELVAREWPTVGNDGTMRVWCCAIDSGDLPQRVYWWGRQHIQPSFANGAIKVREPATVMVCKGRDVWNRNLSVPMKTSQEERTRGLKVVTTGVSGMKLELYRWLRLRPDDSGVEPFGFIHWPSTPTYNERFFKGLVAERLVKTLVKGRPKSVWELPPGVRNEPLDLHTLNRAAAAACGLDQMTPRDWEKLWALLPPSVRPLTRGLGIANDPVASGDGTPPVPMEGAVEERKTEKPTGPATPLPPSPASPPPTWRPPVVSSRWTGRTRLTRGGF